MTAWSITPTRSHPRRRRGRPRRAVTVPLPKLRSLREELSPLLGYPLDLGDPRVVEPRRMLAEQFRVLIALFDAREDQEDLIGVPKARRPLVGPRKDRHLDAAGQVLDLGEHHQLLVLGDVFARARHDARDRHEILARIAQLREIRRHDVTHLRGKRLEWVLGKVDPEKLLLPAE